MFEHALTMRNLSVRKKITYQTLVSAGLIALAVILPQLVHLSLGQPGGVKWLPMYLPVLIGGCLLGAKTALHDDGACSLRTRFRSVHKEDRRKRSLGISGCDPCAALRQSGISRSGRRHTAHDAVHACNDMGTDQNRLCRSCRTGGARAAHHHRTADAAAEGQSR